MGSPRSQIPEPAPGQAPDEAEKYVLAARDGDRGAAQDLLTALLPRVRNLVRYLIRGDEDTDDIAQDSLLAVLRGLSGFRADGSLKSWVNRVVVRTTFTFIRKRTREPATSPARLELVDIRGGEATALSDEYSSRRRAIAILDELPIEQRHALVLHHILEMSVPEIAEHLAIPTETVRSRLRLARTRLRGRGIADDARNVATVNVDQRRDFAEKVEGEMP